jgi:selenocysteine lyase/cysteine desulfurase
MRPWSVQALPHHLAREYREQFPIRDRLVFLNHAGVAPLPAPTYEAVVRTAAEQRDRGHTLAARWEQRTHATRRRAAELLGARAAQVAFIKNTTSGLIIAAESIPWREGENVVTSAIEFPANVYPWLHLARRGVETRMVEPTDGRIGIDDIAHAMDDGTRAVAISWVQYSNGYRSDLGALAELCRSYGAFLVVDAIQGLGAIPFAMEASGADFVAADGHKWLLSTEGCGVLCLSERALERTDAVNVGWLSVEDAWDFGSYDLRLRPEAARLEEGSLNTLGVHALGASLELLLRVGPAAVWEAIEALTGMLVEGLSQRGCSIVSPRGAGQTSGIVCFRHPCVPSDAMVRRLAEAGIVAADRGGAVRLSPHFYNDADDVAAVLDVVAGA